MRTLSLTALLLLAASSPAAPALGDKPPKWEYAELSYRTTPGRPAGVDADGNQVAAIPSTVTVRWISGAGEVEAKGWVELAEKLKALGYKKEGSAAFQKIQFLNYLGSEGWELLEQSGGGGPIGQAVGGFGGRGVGPDGGPVARGQSAPSTWMLKRRVP
jgi:hypothetical protein